MKAEGDLSPDGKVQFSTSYPEADASVSPKNTCFFLSFLFVPSLSRQAVAFLLDCRGNDLV